MKSSERSTKQFELVLKIVPFSSSVCFTQSKVINLKQSNIRSSRPEVFCKKSLLKDFAKFTGKHLCQSLCFNKVYQKKFY